jgi:hypothetical protein
MMKNLNYALGDKVNQVQKVVLHEIANSCSVEHGHAVYSARAFISIINPGILTGYINCDGGQNLARNSKNKIKEKFTIYPNPAQDFIYFSPEIKEDLIVEINDLSGRQLKKTRINQNRIDISNFGPGIYFYRINSDEGKFNGKFSILK